MWKAYLSCVTLLLLSVACQKSEENCEPQQIDRQILEGSWKDTESNIHNMGGHRYNITFEGDSFRRKTTQWTDALIMDCENVGVNHSTGEYFLEGNLLILDGFYSDSSYNAPFQDTSCAQFTYYGEFRDTVTAHFRCDTLVIEQENFPSTSFLLKE